MLDPVALKQELQKELTEAEAQDYPTPAPPPDRELMLAKLQSEQAMERIQGARAFCEIEDQRVIPYLLQFVTDDCPLLRVSAVYALGKNKTDQAVPLLLDRLANDWNDYVRKGVVWALGNYTDRRALALLQQALLTDTAAVRLWTASTLGLIGFVEAIPSLVKGLNHDPVSAVRGNCAWALGKLLPDVDRGSDLFQQGCASLVQALGDEDVSVQGDAREALAKLGIMWED
jgi:HEAT repeat protein